ncbi:MAG: hypothetical protein BroJett003_11680 [Planctomycetota bacterium]|nr:MAG: hypothetical protein BroJett003_11680 [Planctomycetota bacterium]
MSLDTTKPRLVFVTRKSPLQELIERHGTIGQARFYLEVRGESVAYFEDMHERLEQACRACNPPCLRISGART